MAYQSPNINDALATQAAGSAESAAHRLGFLDVHGHSEQIAQAPRSEQLYAQAQTIRPATSDSSQQRKGADITPALNKLSSDAAQTMDAAHRSEFMTELDEFLTQAKLK